MESEVRKIIARICNEKAKNADGIEVCEDYIDGLLEFFMLYFDLLVEDLQNFAKHARRQSIAIEDVKLVIRRNSHLVEILEEKLDIRREIGRSR